MGTSEAPAVELRETVETDLRTLFEFQADPEANAMAAFPSRDLPAFLEHQARDRGRPSGDHEDDRRGRRDRRLDRKLGRRR
jgi:hypothetical protein